MNLKDSYFILETEMKVETIRNVCSQELEPTKENDFTQLHIFFYQLPNRMKALTSPRNSINHTKRISSSQ